MIQLLSRQQKNRPRCRKIQHAGAKNIFTIQNILHGTTLILTHILPAQDVCPQQTSNKVLANNAAARSALILTRFQAENSGMSYTHSTGHRLCSNRRLSGTLKLCLVPFTVFIGYSALLIIIFRISRLSRDFVYFFYKTVLCSGIGRHAGSVPHEHASPAHFPLAFRAAIPAIRGHMAENFHCFPALRAEVGIGDGFAFTFGVIG